VFDIGVNTLAALLGLFTVIGTIATTAIKSHPPPPVATSLIGDGTSNRNGA
jgi:hypothetical protein